MAKGFVVTAWNNGSHRSSGAGYGLKVDLADRDRYFEGNWREIVLVLPDNRGDITINVAKKSFWSGTCRELIKMEIGRWLLEIGLAPWPKGHPPTIELIPAGSNRFEIGAVIQ